MAEVSGNAAVPSPDPAVVRQKFGAAVLLLQAEIAAPLLYWTLWFRGEPLRGDLHDPYLVSVHIITDSGTGKPLQRAADTALAWIHPDLQLFRVSERAPGQRRPKRVSPSGSVPGLAVFLFLREGPAGCLLRTLQRPPWRCYPSERAPRAGLDLFSLGAGTPPWAVRQVHCGREVIRLALNCRHEAFADTVRLYCLLVRRRLTQSTDNFCFFVVYASTDVEIHLSLKRLPRGQSPAPTESAILEFRVQDVGALVPLLPQPCMPISETRWQTEDYDGNKILLQVKKQSATVVEMLTRVPLLFGCSRIALLNVNFHPQLRLRVPEALPLTGTVASIGLLALVGAVETDVDTGRKLAGGGIVDLSVVSGYSCRPTRSISATPVDLVPSFSGRSCSFRASSSRPPPARVSISASATPIATPTALRRPRPRSTCSLNNTWQRGGAEVENGLSEEEQEFYI
ncbi:hypothetical protein Z043_111842 [Scleropages formosus]|uniref:FAM124 domain-containing protein n=1 Tax=Scleropages formosus TaxID=113540 RepID=A0A0P7UHY5_SCLFO|nr:hypothetical protein Z043_111842 [Scleropages formosus]